jgi:protein-S-isoprenylcysteine O-methyltransferase Ste14
LILGSAFELPDVSVGYGLRIVGFALVVGGLTIVYAGYRELANAGQTPAPGYATTRLVTEGIFRYSRNPLCFGYIIALAGAGLFFKSTGLFVAVPLFAVLATWALIRSEEAYLEQVFGEDYRCYARTVRRWV